MRLCSVSNMWLASIQRCCILYSTASAVAGFDLLHQNHSLAEWRESAAVSSCSTCRKKTKHIPLVVSRNGKLDCFSAWKKQLAPILLEENCLFLVLVPDFFKKKSIFKLTQHW